MKIVNKRNKNERVILFRKNEIISRWRRNNNQIAYSTTFSTIPFFLISIKISEMFRFNSVWDLWDHHRLKFRVFSAQKYFVAFFHQLSTLHATQISIGNHLWEITNAKNECEAKNLRSETGWKVLLLSIVAIVDDDVKLQRSDAQLTYVMGQKQKLKRFGFNIAAFGMTAWGGDESKCWSCCWAVVRGPEIKNIKNKTEDLIYSICEYVDVHVAYFVAFRLIWPANID